MRQVFEWVVDNRVPISAVLLVLALASMFFLGSQSASSFFTYFLVLLAIIGYRSWRGLCFDWLFLLAVTLVVYLAVSSFWSSEFEWRGAVSQVTRGLILLSFIIAIAEGFWVDWFERRLTQMVALAGGAAAIASLTVFVAEPPADGRLNGLGQLDTHVRAALVFGVALLCAMRWAARGDSTLITALATLAGLALAVAVALTDSRNAWIAVPMGVVALIVAWRVESRRRFLAIGVASVVGLVVLLAAGLSHDGLREIVLPRGDSFRVAIWTEIWQRTLAAGAWFGAGALTPNDVVIGSQVFQHPHSLYLSVFFQGGVVGSSLFVFVTALAIITLIQHYDRGHAKLGLAIFAIALPSYLLDGFELVDKVGWTWMLYWLPVAMAVSLRNDRALQDAKRFGGG